MRPRTLREARAAARLNHPERRSRLRRRGFDARPGSSWSTCRRGPSGRAAAVRCPRPRAAADRPGGARRTAGGPRGRRAAPRREARQRPDRRRRTGGADRLRAGAHRRRSVRDAVRRDLRLAVVHGAGAGGRRHGRVRRPTCGRWAPRCTSRSRGTRRTSGLDAWPPSPPWPPRTRRAPGERALWPVLRDCCGGTRRPAGTLGAPSRRCAGVAAARQARGLPPSPPRPVPTPRYAAPPAPCAVPPGAPGRTAPVPSARCWPPGGTAHGGGSR